MPELLKNIYNTSFFNHLTAILEEVIPDFDKEVFLHQIYTPNWPNLELKQRMRHISIVLLKGLPQEYLKALPYILRITEKARQTGSANPLAYIFLPDLIEIKGQEDFGPSMDALQQITSFISAEFAVRPFLIRYPDKMLNQMLKWSTHLDEHVRRLASEGCRPRLPWAMAVPYLKKEPQSILPILDNLKNDPSAYVRRSVANNLNDIAKDHPQVVIQTAKKWMGQHPQTDALLKHACRTLIKQGNPDILQLFGFGNKGLISASPLELNKDIFLLGETIEFTFTFESLVAVEIRLQYVIEFARKGEKTGKKVFFLAEKQLQPATTCVLKKKFKLQHYSTRQLHEGWHRISIVANGEEKASARFYLKLP